MAIKVINKIGIIICSARELDMYMNLLRQLPYKKFNLIINDLSISDIEKKKIIGFTKNFKNRFLLSNIYKKRKYSLILSTGEVNYNKISIYSLLRFFYAITVGNFIECTILRKIFIKVFNKPYSAGGMNCTLGLPWYPEKDLGNKIVKFPDGADVKLKIYPLDIHKKIFDFFLYLTVFEQKQLQKRISEVRTKKIVYLRYFYIGKKKFNFNLNFKDQGFDKKKKIIYWLPTFIDTFGEKRKNIELWFPKLEFLNNFYNLIIRIHPKDILENSLLKKKLISHNFIIDDNLNQKTGQLIKSSHVIFCDYGGSIFSSIYLKKPIVLLNFLENSTFVQSLKDLNSLDIKIRRQFINLDLSFDEKKIHDNVKKCLNKNSKNLISKRKNNIFGYKRGANIKQLSKFLLKNIY